MKDHNAKIKLKTPFYHFLGLKFCCGFLGSVLANQPTVLIEGVSRERVCGCDYGCWGHVTGDRGI